MQTLAQFIQQIEEQYADVHTESFLTEKIGMSNLGSLCAGDQQLRLSAEAECQFARRLSIPPAFLPTIEPDIRAMLFNRRLQGELAAGTIPAEMHLIVDKDRRVLGFDDPLLLKLTATSLLQLVLSSVPPHLSAERIEVSRVDCSPTILSFSCFTPQKAIEPRVGDVVNGGIDVHHTITGESATQIRCYFQRLVCKNGATVHICRDGKRARSRRLSTSTFAQVDMVMQIRGLLVTAWQQIDDKLDAMTKLLEQPPVSFQFLDRQRTRFSLNNDIIQAIENAIDDDELAPTDSPLDLFNAMSRTATHEESLSLRQRRTLMYMAGEFSQHHVRLCSQCGSLIMERNTAQPVSS